MKYLLSPAGQTIWAEQGYRPVLPKVAARFDFPTPKKLFTIASLGGWTRSTRPSSTRRPAGRGQIEQSPRATHDQQLISQWLTSSSRRRAAAARSASGWRRLPRRGSGPALAVTYLSLLVLLPVAAVVTNAFTGGWHGFWLSVTNPSRWPPSS